MPASIMVPERSAKYAGPEPDTAVDGVHRRPGVADDAARCERTSSASCRCSSPACAPAARPAMLSCIADGALGIARTTGTPSARRSSICAVGIAAATERTVCSVDTAGLISPRSAEKSQRLDGDHDDRRAGDGLGVRLRRVDAVALAQLGDVPRGAP